MHGEVSDGKFVSILYHDIKSCVTAGDQGELLPRRKNIQHGCSTEAGLCIGAAASKLCVDAAEAVGVLGKDCGCFQPLVDEVLLELLEKVMRLQLLL